MPNALALPRLLAQLDVHELEPVLAERGLRHHCSGAGKGRRSASKCWFEQHKLSVACLERCSPAPLPPLPLPPLLLFLLKGLQPCCNSCSWQLPLPTCHHDVADLGLRGVEGVQEQLGVALWVVTIDHTVLALAVAIARHTRLAHVLCVAQRQGGKVIQQKRELTLEGRPLCVLCTVGWKGKGWGVGQDRGCCAKLCSSCTPLQPAPSPWP